MSPTHLSTGSALLTLCTGMHQAFAKTKDKGKLTAMPLMSIPVSTSCATLRTSPLALALRRSRTTSTTAQ
jgi:hypothetical protein